jgi:hypothetical protein
MMKVERTICFLVAQQAQTSAPGKQGRAGMKMLAAHDRRFDVVDGKLDQILDPNRRRS